MHFLFDLPNLQQKNRILHVNRGTLVRSGMSSSQCGGGGSSSSRQRVAQICGFFALVWSHGLQFESSKSTAGLSYTHGLERIVIPKIALQAVRQTADKLKP